MNAITKGYQDVPMTRRRAQLLEEYASKLADMLEAAPNDKDLAEWVQSKIDRAAAAIQSAYHYLDQDDESDDLEKARTKKYDYRRPSKRINKKTGKREWDYFYTKKHGARVIRGAFEAGAAFRMTWRGRKGHFHIHHVKGDQVFITHDSRPDMEPIPVQADELRALLERQHKREVDQHLKRKTRKVEEIKRRAHRGGLGLALHRLRQAAAQAGVTLPEQYQRKPKKTRAQVAETAREAETPRDQLTSTAQQIIEDANQEHGERHDEHQEITRFELGEHTHTKTGAKLYTAKQTERVERDEYFRRLEIAKRHGGRYERRYVRGFVFKTAEDARAFALEVEGAAQETPETSAETVTPHDEHPGAENFETMPEVESAPTQRLRGVLDALSESERLNTINPKNRKRPKEAKGADAKLIKLINELAEDQDPNERRFLKVMASMLQDVKKQYPRSAYERRESRKDRYATIREFIEKKLGVEPTVTAPRLNEILSRPTTPSTRPTNLHSRSIKGTVDQALSSEPTGIDLNNARSVLPSKGDLREMLSQEQRLKRAKEDLVSTGAPNFLGQKNPMQDITYALSRYLNGPYVELGQGRIRETERGFKISLRDARGEDLEQVKDEIARFWREWGGEYKRLQDEFARGRTQGEALRNIRPLIPKHALTPEINQQLDQMERELDQKPVSGRKVSEWINTRDTNEATRDRQPTTPREQLTATAREVTQGADNFETMPEVEARDLKAYKRVRRLARKAEKLDRATGRRTNESKKADQSLAQAARSLLETEFADLPSTQEISRKRQTRLTPEEARKATITGALNKLERNQTASRAGSAAQAYENRSEARAILEREMRDRLEAAAPLPTPRDRGPQIEEPPRTTIYDDVPLAKPRPEPRAQTVDKYTAAIYSERLDTKPAFKYSDARSAIERYQDGATSTKADRELLEETAGDLSPFINRLLDEHRPVGLGIKAHDARYQRYKDYADHAGFTIPSQMELTAPGRSNFEIIKKIGLHLLSSVNLTETSTRGDLTKELARSFAQYDEATRDKQPTAPARQALTETTERVTSDQTAEQATTRATPRPSEETLRGSGELDETVRANLQDRAQYLLRMPEDTTKTGMRSKAQRAKDSELLLIYMRLQSDAQARLGPTAPPFNETHTRLMEYPGIGMNTALMTPYRAELREGIKDAIRELEQATSGQVQKSARPLITYRAQLIQTVERLTAA